MAKMRVLDFVEPLAEHLVGQPADGVSLYWLGQAGFLIRAGGRTLLIDPYLSDSLAEKYRGTRFPHERMMPPPIAIGELPPVDCVLVTHQHTDHMDPQTLTPIAKAFPACRFVVPRASTEEAVKRIDVPPARLVAMDAGESVEPLAGVRIHAVRAAHETLERDTHGNHRFLGYVLETGGVRIYHSGDTVPFDGLVDDVKPLAPDVALLPVNGRRPDLGANGVPGNLSLEEAVDLARALGAGAAVFHHYGLFAFNTADPRVIDAAVETAMRGCCETTLLRAQTGREYRVSQS